MDKSLFESMIDCFLNEVKPSEKEGCQCQYCEENPATTEFHGRKVCERCYIFLDDAEDDVYSDYCNNEV